MPIGFAFSHTHLLCSMQYPGAATIYFWVALIINLYIPGCLLSTFSFWCDCSWHQLGLICLGLNHCNPLKHITDRHMCLLVLVFGPHRSAVSSCFSHVQVGWYFMLLKQLSPSHSVSTMGHTALGIEQSHLIPLPSLPYMVRRDLLQVWWNQMT